MSRPRPPAGFVPNIRPDAPEPGRPDASAPRHGRMASFEDSGAAPAAPPGPSSAARLEELRRELIAEDWRDPDKLTAAAELCLELGRRDEGRTMLLRALKIDRNHARARGILTGLVSAHELWELGVEEPSHVFRADARDLLRYPLRGNGLVAIISAAVLFGAIPIAVNLFAGAGGGWGTANLLVLCSVIFMGFIYMLLFLRDVVYASATGTKEAPEWPELYMDKLFGNAFRLLAISAVAWLPALVAGMVLFRCGAKLLAAIVPLALLVPGMYVFPMMFLYHVMTRNVLAAFDLPRMLRCARLAAPGYRRAAAVWAGGSLAMGGLVLAAGIWYGALGPLLAAAAVYLLMLAGRALGLVFQAHREKLDWMG